MGTYSAWSCQNALWVGGNFDKYETAVIAKFPSHLCKENKGEAIVPTRGILLLTCNPAPIPARLQNCKERCLIVQILAMRAPWIRWCFNKRNAETLFSYYKGETIIEMFSPVPQFTHSSLQTQLAIHCLVYHWIRALDPPTASSGSFFSQSLLEWQTNCSSIQWIPSPAQMFSRSLLLYHSVLSGIGLPHHPYLTHPLNGIEGLY